MLTADAFGVLPPISRLSPEQAMYHFLSGYTARVAGTEQGVKEPQATFSTCFGAPFMPRQPTVYAEMLRDFMRRHEVDCWLVNTGWSGGPYGTGERMSLRHTRAMLHAALGGALAKVPFRRHPEFGLMIPEACPGVPGAILDPQGDLGRSQAYDRMARDVAGRFEANFARFVPHVDDAVTGSAGIRAPFRRPSATGSSVGRRRRAGHEPPCELFDVKEAQPLAVNWLAKPLLQTDTARRWRHRAGAQCSRRSPPGVKRKLAAILSADVATAASWRRRRHAPHPARIGRKWTRWSTAATAGSSAPPGTACWPSSRVPCAIGTRSRSRRSCRPEQPSAQGPAARVPDRHQPRRRDGRGR